MATTTHTLKLQARFFDDVATGRKPFEIRNNDRQFKEGDRIVFHEFDGNKRTGRVFGATVGYMLKGWGLQPGYVAFAVVKQTPITHVIQEDQ